MRAGGDIRLVRKVECSTAAEVEAQSGDQVEVEGSRLAGSLSLSEDEGRRLLDEGMDSFPLASHLLLAEQSRQPGRDAGMQDGRQAPACSWSLARLPSLLLLGPTLVATPQHRAPAAANPGVLTPPLVGPKQKEREGAGERDLEFTLSLSLSIIILFFGINFFILFHEF